jgi:4-oxalmesaconate hydratase
LFKVIPLKNILFGSEMVGAVRGIDPETGNYYDDTKLYVDKLGLSAADLKAVYEGNIRQVYPRINKILGA